MEDTSIPCDSVTPEMVLEFQKPTKQFLCPLSANIYNIDFLEFEVIDDESNTVLFKVAREPTAIDEIIDLDPEIEHSIRTIRYAFPKQFLQLKNIRTALVFSVGEQPVENFRMIERHYHGDKLIRSYDFEFGFCVPGSNNSWEALYPLPSLNQQQVEDMINVPFSNKSDSFYFAGNPPRLIMHNKAEYEWID